VIPVKTVQNAVKQNRRMVADGRREFIGCNVTVAMDGSIFVARTLKKSHLKILTLIALIVDKVITV